MPFQTMSAVDYRNLDIDALDTRKAEIIAELENEASEVATDLLDAECRMCNEEYARRNKLAELRNSTMREVAGGAGAVIERSVKKEEKVVEDIDPYDTPEYRKAFMEFVCRGVAIPRELRNDAVTTTSDASAVTCSMPREKLLLAM